MKPFILAAVLAFGLVMPASAAQRGLDVAEINWFYYDECQNVFWWQTDSEINIWAFRLEHPATRRTGNDRRNTHRGRRGLQVCPAG